MLNMSMHEPAKIVMGAPPAASSTSDYVCLKGFSHMTAILILDNATTVTGSDITINQATSVGGGSAKTIDASGVTRTCWRNIDTGSADALAAFTVTAGAFTTDNTDAKNLLYVIEINAGNDLDVANGFDCIQIANASGSSTIIGIVYLLHGSRYATVAADQPTAITD